MECDDDSSLVFPDESVGSLGSGKSTSSQRGKSRIQVVVRKRPLNRREQADGEVDIVAVHPEHRHVRISEPKVKVDLTKYTQKHDFVFDAVYDERTHNHAIYERSVRPLLDTVFKERGKATCFAYGQTGSGKTYTLLGNTEEGRSSVRGIYVLAVRDIYRTINSDRFSGRLRVVVSFFEIYGGKLFDLLAKRAPIFCREDGKQKVNIVGLKKQVCMSEDEVMDVIAMGNDERQTGSTGANAVSSRSHAILQLDLMTLPSEVTKKDGPFETKVKVKPKLHGRLSFIDLAGAERGADTAANDKQTRREGSEINQSLLALKECIRALDQNHSHKPFRGSKLTHVLRESLTGRSRTVMIANISPNSGACENTLNTLRYADRVKELKGSGLASLPSIKNPSVDPYMPHKSRVSGASMHRNASEPSLQGRPATARASEGTSNRRSMTKIEEERTSSVKRRKSSASISKPSAMIDGRPRIRATKASPAIHTDRGSSKKRKGIAEAKRNEDVDMRDRSVERSEESNDNRFDSGIQRPRAKTPRMNAEATEAPAKSKGKTGSSKQLIRYHRRHIDEFMSLIREDMRILKAFDTGGLTTDEYVSKLEDLLAKQAKSILTFQDKLQSHAQ